MSKNLKNKKNIIIRDFLYKNLNLLDSIYSQVFSGITSNINFTHSFNKKSDFSLSASGNISIPFLSNIKTQITHLTSLANAKNIMTNKTPYDYRIVELLDYLDLTPINEIDNTIISDSSLVLLNGNLKIRNLNLIKSLIPKMLSSKSNFFFKNIKCSKSKCPNIAYFSYIYDLNIYDILSEFIPDGHELEININSQNIIGILDDSSLESSFKNLVRIDDSQVSANWYTLGIISKINHDIYFPESIDSFENLVDSLSLFLQSQIYSFADYLIKPILIFQNVNYL